jgi:hypothetical protein
VKSPWQEDVALVEVVVEEVEEQDVLESWLKMENRCCYHCQWNRIF